MRSKIFFLVLMAFVFLASVNGVSAWQCDDLSVYHELNTTGGSYYINLSDTRIYCIRDRYTNDFLTMNTSGIAFNDGSNWLFTSQSYREGASFPVVSSIYNSSYVKFVANSSNFNFTIIYDTSYDYLDVFFNSTYLGSSDVNTSDVRFVMNWNLSYFASKDYYLTPNSTSTDFSSKQSFVGINSSGSDISITIMATNPYRDVFSIEKANNTYIDRVIFGVKDWVGASGYLTSIGSATESMAIQTSDRKQTTIQSRYNFFNQTFNNHFYNYVIDISDSSIVNSKDKFLHNYPYSEPSLVNSSRGAWWQFGCGTNDWVSYTNQEFQDAYDYGARFVHLHCYFPVYGNFTLEGQWNARSGGSINQSVINDVINKMEAIGLRTYIYTNPTELYNLTAITSDFSSSIVTNSSRQIRYGYPSTTLMSLSDSTYWRNYTYNQSITLLNNLENLTGIFVDRLDYNHANYNYSSSRQQLFYDSANMIYYSKMREPYYDYMRDLSNYAHSNGKYVACNVLTTYSFDQYCDINTGDRASVNTLIRDLLSTKTSKPYFAFWISPLTALQSQNTLISFASYPYYVLTDLYSQEFLRLSSKTSKENVLWWDLDTNCTSLTGNLISCSTDHTFFYDSNYSFYDHTNRKILDFNNNSVTLDYNGTTVELVEYTGISSIVIDERGNNYVYNGTRLIDDGNTDFSITGSSTQKTITSSLVDSINATVVAQFPNCDGSRFTYNNQIISSGFSCSSGTYTFNQLQINNGNNILTESQTCVLGEVIGYNLVLIVVSAGILGLCFFLLKGDMDFSNNEFKNLNLKTILLVFFLIIITVPFLVSMANTFAARCTL